MRFDSIVFDLGNTLLPWDERESAIFYGAMRETFEAAVGPMPDFFERGTAARDRLIAERKYTSMREVRVEEYVDAICDAPTPPGLADAVAETMHRTFVEMYRVPDGLGDLLGRLGERRPLAVLSNFLLTAPIHDVLKRNGLFDHFVHVEVSAMSGYAKPHPVPFDVIKAKLRTPMERTLMVGDEFWADVVGGYRAGFLTALTFQHRRGPDADTRAPEVSADRILHGLDELEES